MESSNNGIEAGTSTEWPKRLLMKRNIALCSMLVAGYCILGSIFEPYCAYGYIWRLSFSDNPCWISWSNVLDHPWRVVVVLTILIGADKLRKFGAPALSPSWLDLRWRVITSASMFACIATAGIVYAYANDGYDFWAASQSVEITLGDNSLRAEPNIEPPLDFLFIDNNSVEALYNQIEPDLIEKRRTVSNSGKVSGKAGIEAGAITAAVESDKARDSTGSYERIEFAPARRCLAVMQFVAESKRAAYYTDFNEWRSVREAQEKVASDLAAANGALPASNGGKEPALKNAFFKELQEAEGLVFVRGQFLQESRPQQPGTLVLTSEFAGAPKKVIFKVLVPHEAPNGTDALRLATGANLTVFGRITKPLTESGTVEIRPFAIF